MSITINGSGTITGISVGGLPDGSITNDDLAGSIDDAKLSGTTAKAWVNFNGTGTVAIRAQYNVSSITDNGTGSYTVNLTTATADANGSAIVTTWRTTTSTPDQSVQTQAYQSGVSTVDIRTYNTASTATDHGYINVALFR
jgi:hypothetical protein